MKRRRLVLMMTSAILIVAFSLAGCRSTPMGNEMTQETNQKETTSGSASSKVEETAAPSAFKQSPYLDGIGLPPVQERLPKEPKLTNELPKDALNYEIGTYGGKLRTVRTDPISDSDIFTIENEPLVNSPGLMGEEITPNVLKAYKVSDDQKEITFTLREGMRWSDGELVTVDDVRFAVEDVLFNKELTTTFPLWLKSTAYADDKPLTFTVLDNNTFKISFDHPYGGFLMQLAVQGWRGYTDFLKPKHFLQKYHVKYTPLEKLEPLIKEAGFGPGEWTKLFTSKDVLNIESTQPKAVGFPVLSPYMQVKAGTVIEFERNPYYFKIDAKGNQLPYIDKLESTMVQNVETAVLKVMGGEVDHSYEYVTIPKVAMLKENEKKGHYKVYINKLHRTANDIHLNLTYEDPVWRQVVRDVRFRKALNLALNKKEFVNSIFLGFAKPSSIEGTDRNLEEAGRLLDEMGLVKGPDGFRLGPDGKKFIIPFEVSSYYDDFIQLGELVVEQWKEVGLQVTLKKIENSLWNSRVQSNQLQATIMFTPGPVQWARQEWGQNLWAPLWDKWWNTSGKQGEEPPAEAKALFNAIFKLRELPLQEALKKREDIRKNIGENYWYYIHSEDIVAPVAVNEKIGNFTDKGWGIAQNFAGEQWFFRN
ncbi:ABC transporter substrate-binding protein [Paenibacillus frigoriresistens]|uniref:ABC transporter substrate-binding protein n=1 Tax=Paenibacillus alginolyticus TaxID=59839 RepID=UPI00156634B6|nr:ABC transporter substrate-binding protein [Paenibacillus frigoriresistens]NRF95363.1 ABC transporter substrate-binding protein [Paenibacillus frigoriresistens]